MWENLLLDDQRLHIVIHSYVLANSSALIVLFSIQGFTITMEAILRIEGCLVPEWNHDSFHIILMEVVVLYSISGVADTLSRASSRKVGVVIKAAFYPEKSDSSSAIDWIVGPHLD